MSVDEDSIGEVSGDCLASFRALSQELTGNEETLFSSDLEHLKDTPARFRWAELNILYRRLNEVSPEELTLAEIGESLIRLPKLGTLLRSVALVMSPRTLYYYAVPFTLRHVFSHLDVRVLMEKSSVVVEIKIPEEYEDSPWFFQITTGVYRSYPNLIGLHNAEVSCEIEPRFGRYKIIPPNSRTIWAQITRFAAVLYKNLKSVPSLISLLLKQQRQLNQQYQELIASHDALHAAHASTEQILKIMSHELRTPLNGIRGAIDMLRDEKDPKVIKELLDALDESSSRQTKTLADISDVAKAVTHKLLISPGECRIRSVIEEACRASKELAKNKWLEFKLHFSESVPGRLIVDEGRVSQLISHVVDNAVKFSHIGSVCVDIWCDHPTSALCIKVKDDGIGMKPSRIDKVFNLFYQVETGAERSAQGLGLGLTLCKYIVDEAGGGISIESTIGIGTTVEMWVPYEPISQDFLTETPDINYEHKMVLVVDDNKVNRLVLGRMAKKLGLNVDYAENGVMAVAKTGKSSYDAIFMDIEMPEMNGVEASRAIRKMGVETPIIAVTAYTMPEDRNECFLAGMDDFLSKPINGAVIEGRIKKWIR